MEDDAEAAVRHQIEQQINKNFEGSSLLSVHWAAFVDVLDIESGERTVRRMFGDGTPEYLADHLPEIWESQQSVVEEEEEEE